MIEWRKVKPSSAVEKVQLTTDDAWKTLSLVNDWIKHGETKAAATLAAAGVSGTVLFNILKSETHHSVLTVVFTAACGTFIAITGTLAGIALWPRLKATEDPTSTLYFNHIARRHRNGHGEYAKALRDLIQDKERLVGEISEQVWANAHVATKKYRWGSLALISLFIGIALLGASAIAALTT